jgi:hypothetical protein
MASEQFAHKQKVRSAIARWRETVATYRDLEA